MMLKSEKNLMPCVVPPGTDEVIYKMVFGNDGTTVLHSPLKWI